MRHEICAEAWHELELVLLKWGISYETDFIEKNDTIRLNVDIDKLAVAPESEEI